MSQRFVPRTRLARAINSIEETAIAVILGAMTVITFVNVILRYVFNSSLIWGLEVTLILFAWLVLLGMSYAVKVTAHLGVDVILNLLRPSPRRWLAGLAVLACLIYAALLLKGAWDYWAPFAGYQQTGGRWFPEGFVRTRDQGFYVTEQVRIPEFIGAWLGERFNQGETYEKLPRFIPYFILPFGAALLLVRLGQAAWQIVAGTRLALIVSHEAEDAVADVAHMNKDG